MRALPPVLVLSGLFSLGCAAGFPSDGIFDWDGDGFGTSDCDDLDPDVNPTAEERCDTEHAIDEDCDGAIDDDDVNVRDEMTFYRDGDGDGHGDRDNRDEGCEAAEGFVADADDCDDDRDHVSPSAEEVCDSDRTDEDCDGNADDDDDAASGKTTVYADDDGDNYGNAATAEDWCHPPSERVDDGTDCDDDDDEVHPRAQEVCDGIDNDCDGGTDDDDASGAVDAGHWYEDSDGDGYGAGVSRDACEAEAGEVSQGGDCDDADASVNPAAEEICDDGIDQDCDYTGGNCFIGGSTTAGDADATVLGTGTSDEFGYAIASGGDTDGDGVAEVWVSGVSVKGSGFATGSGVAVRVTGLLSGQDDFATLGLDAVYSLETYQVGTALASGADLDGDGLDDLALGAPMDDRGLVLLFAGPVVDGWNESDALATVEGNESGDGVGGSVAIGDFTGDGVADLFLNEPDDDRVTGFFGAFSDGQAFTTSDFDLVADTESAARVALGDVSGDGLADLVAGDYEHSRAYVYEGGQSGSLDSSDRLATFDSDYPAISLGYAVLAGHDYDQDGYGDMVLGCPATDGGKGMIYLVEGPLEGEYAESEVQLEVRGLEDGAYVGSSLAFAADSNDNGDPELIVGAFGTADYTGAVYVLDGSPSSGSRDVNDVDLVISGEYTRGEFGQSVGAADIDGDGRTDILVGAYHLDRGYGGAAIFYGAGI